MLYDLFICHASEDKEPFVRPLADALRAENVEVWYDEFSLELGDSIRRSIDKGLRQSRFGVVVLSTAFFSKPWPQYELDGLTEIEMKGRDKVILPVWHGISHQDVVDHSPSLANRQAVSSAQGIEAVAQAILRVVRPQESPLIAARDLLLEWGVTPPVITDQYWLEVVEASNRIPAFGATVPETAAWGRWTFPLPPKDGGPQKWGERLAWTALQLRWSEAAERQAITPLTCPQGVLDFIDSQPGLYETCEMFPSLLIEYVPQFTIPGAGGKFEDLFAKLYQQSVENHARMRREESTSGSALTTSGECPLCDEEWALRHPSFGEYEPAYVACEYFSGGMFGPPVSPYGHTDHAVWLLSETSRWLSKRIHDYLLVGMAEWPVWPWGYPNTAEGGDWPSNGALFKALCDAREGKQFRWTARLKDDALNRFQMAIDILGLPDRSEDILGRFIEHDFPGRWIRSERTIRARQGRIGKTKRRGKKGQHEGRHGR
jgi:hypothetical protein